MCEIADADAVAVAVAVGLMLRCGVVNWRRIRELTEDRKLFLTEATAKDMEIGGNTQDSSRCW